MTRDNPHGAEHNSSDSVSRHAHGDAGQPVHEAVSETRDAPPITMGEPHADRSGQYTAPQSPGIVQEEPPPIVADARKRSEDSRARSAVDVAVLRSEVSNVKQCFTDFSFRALALSLVALSTAFGLMEKFPQWAAYVPLPAIGLLMAVCRIGIFKYSTANRNLGYELHLARVRHIEGQAVGPNDGLWRSSMRDIEWEEALRAWRVVQPTLFRAIYRTPQADGLAIKLKKRGFGWINYLRSDLYELNENCKSLRRHFRNAIESDDNYPWFIPAELVRWQSDRSKTLPSAYYYAGSYLQGMLSTLAVTQGLMLLPLVIGLSGRTGLRLPVDILVLVAALVAIICRARRMSRRRVILEEELLSIHSCAIVWEAVVICHFKAIALSSRQNSRSLAHYTECLTQCAQEVASRPFAIHAWFSGKPASTPPPMLDLD